MGRRGVVSTNFYLVKTYGAVMFDLGFRAVFIDAAREVVFELRGEIPGFGITDACGQTQQTFI